MKAFVNIILVSCCLLWLFHSSSLAQRSMTFSGINEAGETKTLVVSEGKRVYVILQNDSLLHKGKFRIADSLHFILEDGQKNILLPTTNVNTLYKINCKATTSRKNLSPLLGVIGAFAYVAANRNNVMRDSNRWMNTFSSFVVGASVGYGIGIYFDIHATRKNMIRINAIKTKNY